MGSRSWLHPQRTVYKPRHVSEPPASSQATGLGDLVWGIQETRPQSLVGKMAAFQVTVFVLCLRGRKERKRSTRVTPTNHNLTAPVGPVVPIMSLGAFSSVSLWEQRPGPRLCKIGGLPGGVCPMTPSAPDFPWLQKGVLGSLSLS